MLNLKILKTRKIFLLTLGIAGLAVIASAQEIATFQQPVLITSAGQCIDWQTVEILVKRAGIQYKAEPESKPADLSGIKTLLVVVGHSLKGLGAAGIGEKEELERVNRVLDEAKNKDIPVVLFHIGGTMRRGPTSEPYIDAVLARSKYVVVWNKGNEDKKFTQYCESNKIPMTEIEKVAQVRDILKAMFKL